VLDLLQNLVGKSLVAVDEQTDHQLPRYHLLETVRQYARGKLLESGEEIALRNRHINYFLQLAEESNSKLLGAEQVNWLNRLDAEQDNFRAALTWAMETTAEKGLHLTERLSKFWVWRGYWLEAREWFTKMLALPAASSPTAARAELLLEAFNTPFYRGDLAQSKAMLEESLVIWRKLGDKSGIAKALYGLGELALSRSDIDVAEQSYREGLTLCRGQGDRQGTCRSLIGLGNVTAAKGDWLKATDLFQESLAIFRELGHKENTFEHGDENPTHELGFVAESQGDFARAQEFYEEGLTLERELGSTHHISWALRILGALLCRQGDFGRAEVLYEESLTLVQSMKDKHCTAHSLIGLARVAQQVGDDQRAVELTEEALPLCEQIDSKTRISEAQQILGGADKRRDSERATDLLKSSLRLGQELGLRRGTAQTLQALGSVYLLGGKGERAVRFYAMADAMREVISFPMTPWELAAREKELSIARAQLGEAEFNAAWEEGRKLTLDQAIEGAQK
jgi:tetratricopeptide (TPR) repeat protein